MVEHCTETQKPEFKPSFALKISYLLLVLKKRSNCCDHVKPGAHQMELPSPLISWVNPFPSRVINRTIFFCNALESHECACCLLSFLLFYWLFPLSAPNRSRSIYKSTWERVDSKGLYGRCRLHLMSSWSNLYGTSEWSKSLLRDHRN